MDGWHQEALTARPPSKRGPAKRAPARGLAKTQSVLCAHGAGATEGQHLFYYAILSNDF